MCERGGDEQAGAEEVGRQGTEGAGAGMPFQRVRSLSLIYSCVFLHVLIYVASIIFSFILPTSPSSFCTSVQLT